MAHDDYKELIPMHALSALDAGEERALNEHLAECAECRRDLAEWEATAASLALSAKPMEPSPQVREKLLTQIRSEKSASDNRASNVVPFGRPNRNLWSSLGSLGSIAAIILFGALLVSVVALWRQNRQLKLENQFYELLAAPDSRITELIGSTEAAGATAKLAYDPNGNVILVADGLPRPPAGKEYQIWYFVEHKPLPGKSFAPDPNGKVTMKDEMPFAARQRPSLEFAVTLEPAGGVSIPTGGIYLFTEQ